MKKLIPIVLTCFLIGLKMNTEVYANSISEFRVKLPHEIMGWEWEGSDSLYDERTIFHYINGAGEVYRAYNMKQCLSRQYLHSSGPKIILDIFDMGTSEDAFGVFTRDLDGQVLSLGHDSRYRSGWISMWKGRFFVSIYAELDTKESAGALKKLAGSISELIKDKGRKPSILASLPKEGIRSGNIRFFHNHVLLNTHYFLSNKNILKLGPETDAALAQYKTHGKSALLMLVNYPDKDRTAEAYDSFLNNYLPDADARGAKLIENNKWCGIKQKGRTIAIVLEANTRTFMEQLLKASFENQ